MKNISIFASGSGTNAENIIEYSKKKGNFDVKFVLSNKKDAYVIERAKKHDIPAYVFNREELYEGNKILTLHQKNDIDLIILAGFLWLIPSHLIHAYPNRIINIHPALLPKHGGKGMYGRKVHESVINNKEKETGITIHYVNPEYDKGTIIFQAKCEVKENDTPESLEARVHQLEHKYYPLIIDKLLETV